ncbi:helix-turn-helix domain-containing protein [Pedobacter panaciterrae]
MSINQRIAYIINIKYGGSQKTFAERMGWSQQYVSKLITEGGSVGMEPVKRILEEFEDIDARWLITGKGSAIDKSFITDITDSLYSNIRQLLDLEKFIPYMLDTEREEYKAAASGLKKASFTTDQVDRWTRLYQDDQFSKSHLEHH